ncbi:serine hydrolase [Dyella nitratireducens]|uniref:Penicillin-binding protein n=1 Tax=Dyella nitratireducens TaxID=1849580 RepID=A0ABQ1FUW2_9GAMM|nr:serine hydrolase [Dyella nitratireducens]GGA29443.1 penicillin-binding protein [Dyella nitratireducens]GLQ43138.1 penicillin-binding protein [Dyella nitratireducens]
MNRKLIAIALLAVAGSTSAASPALPPRVDAAAQQRVNDGEYPALVIGVVDGDHSQIYTYGKLTDGKAPTADTVFEIGSITKTFTATLLAEAVTKNELRLDQPVASLLPDFKIPSRNGKPITLGELGMQDSGLPRLPTNFHPAHMDDPYADYSLDLLKAFLATYSLPRDPGENYEYSNLGAALLGYALGRHAGSSYDKLVQAWIFMPLGMDSTATTIDAAMRSRLAQGHDATGKPVGNWNVNLFVGAGGIRSTGNDMLRYLKANMGLTPSPLYTAMQLAQTPRTSGPGPENRIGLIWMTQHGPDGDVIWHNGMTGGYASFIGFTADRRHGVVILTNTATDVDDLGFATLRAAWPLAPAHKNVSLSTQVLDEYQGTYRLSPAMLLNVFRADNQLVAQATGQGAFPLYASGKDEFFASVSDIRISFKHDAQGKVDTLVLHQHGDHVAPKLSTAEADALRGNKEVAIDPATLGNYAGRYQLAPNAIFVVTVQNGQLMVKLGGQPSFPVYASARDRFFYRVVDAKIDFERDEHGRVDALVLHQNGADKRAPKLGD